MAKKRRNIPRQPNGQPSRRNADVQAARVEREADILRGPLEARARMTGLAEEVFRDWAIGKPNPGTHHGLLCLQGFIGPKQWAAAGVYLEKRDANSRAVRSPANAIVRDGCSSHATEDSSTYVQWCRTAISEWSGEHGILAVLQHCSVVNRSPIISAFDVIMDREKIVPHMIGDLRLGLNEIHARFVVGNKKAA